MAGLRGATLIVNLPGSPGGCRDGFAVLRPALQHGLELASGDTATLEFETEMTGRYVNGIDIIDEGFHHHFDGLFHSDS